MDRGGHRREEQEGRSGAAGRSCEAPGPALLPGVNYVGGAYVVDTGQWAATAYLSRCIRGALLHHGGDLGRTIRMSRREQEKPGTNYHWVLTSLDQLLHGGEGTLLDLVVDQASEASQESHASAELVALHDPLSPRQASIMRLRHLQVVGSR